MALFIKISLIIHVIAGIGALIFGGTAIALKNNTPKHRIVGKIYFVCMTIIFVTGVYISLYKNNIFLFLIAVFTYYAICVAYRALKLKQLNISQKPELIDWVIEVIAGIAFLGLVVFAVYYYIKNNSMETLIPFVFGTMGIYGVYKNTVRLLTPPKETLVWLKVHIGNMCGSYIGAITAFIVNQSEYIPLPSVVLWLGPTVIIMPILLAETKKVKSVKIKS